MSNIKEIKSARTGDVYYKIEHDSGLTIYLYKKPEYNSKYAIFGTRYGSVNNAFSLDGGEHWTSAQPSIFTSPLSPMKIARHPSGRLYSIWNPIPNYFGRETSRAGWGRTPLSMAFSDDDGVT